MTVAPEAASSTPASVRALTDPAHIAKLLAETIIQEQVCRTRDCSGHSDVDIIRCFHPAILGSAGQGAHGAVKRTDYRYAPAQALDEELEQLLSKQEVR